MYRDSIGRWYEPHRTRDVKVVLQIYSTAESKY